MRESRQALDPLAATYTRHLALVADLGQARGVPGTSGPVRYDAVGHATFAGTRNRCPGWFPQRVLAVMLRHMTELVPTTGVVQVIRSINGW